MIVVVPLVPFAKRDHSPPPTESIFWARSVEGSAVVLVPFGKRDHSPSPTESIFWARIVEGCAVVPFGKRDQGNHHYHTFCSVVPFGKRDLETTQKRKRDQET